MASGFAWTGACELLDSTASVASFAPPHPTDGARGLDTACPHQVVPTPLGEVVLQAVEKARQVGVRLAEAQHQVLAGLRQAGHLAWPRTAAGAGSVCAGGLPGGPG